MGKDSKLGIEGVYIVALALLIMLLVFTCEDADAIEFEAGPGLLSGEYSEGGALIFSGEFANRWHLGGGYVSKQTCHCNQPADLRENIFFEVQRRAQWRAVQIGIGPAYWQNTNRALGKNLTWSLMLGLKFDRLSVRFRHYSNAGSGTPNLGQDMVTIGWRFGDGP